VVRQEYLEELCKKLIKYDQDIIEIVQFGSSVYAPKYSRDIEAEGYILPEKEVFGVIEEISANAIIGLNIMEKYGIYIEDNKIKLKQYPPTIIHSS
jgi:hypothetical protein